MQALQSRRTSRCASKTRSVDASRNGSIPMSSRRLIAESESLVWIVESTKWPVRAARRQIRAVSWSRTSPTMITSGSCRKKARRALANVNPTWVLTCTWLMPLNLYSTGSSTVQMFVSGSFNRFRQA